MEKVVDTRTEAPGLPPLKGKQTWDEWEDADGQDIDSLVAKGAIAVPTAHVGMPLPTAGE